LRNSSPWTSFFSVNDSSGESCDGVLSRSLAAFSSLHPLWSAQQLD
jgi:hypothetical protein